MKRQAAIISALYLMGLLSVSLAGAASDGLPVTGPSTAGAIDKGERLVLKSDVVGQTLAVPAAPSTSSTVYRDIPSISANYSVGGTTLKPYIGAGFGSGFSSDLDRSLSGGSSILTDSSLRSLFGQNLTPSEFQMGIRIPF